VLTLSEGFDDEDEIDKGEENDVEFLKSGEYATEAFQSAEEPFYFVALLVQFAIILPGIEAV
jgi:hypothetical protein